MFSNRTDQQISNAQKQILDSNKYQSDFSNIVGVPSEKRSNPFTDKMAISEKGEEKEVDLLNMELPYTKGKTTQEQLKGGSYLDDV